MGIGQGGYSSVLAVVCQFISFWNRFLCPGVFDGLSICFLRKVCHGLGPVIFCTQGKRCSSCFSICKKTYNDALWTDSILVLIISPQLLDSCTGLSWGVTVDDVIIVVIIGCSVIYHRSLAYSVSDFLTVCVFRQICKAISPVSFLVSCYGLAIHFRSVCKKLHGNALWTFAVLIVCIIPGLGSTDFSCFWLVGVDEVVSSNLCGIASNCILGYSVNDFVTIFIFRQISEAVAPDSPTIRAYGLALDLGSVCKKVDGYALRTDSVLVICVIPGLGSVDFGCL